MEKDTKTASNVKVKSASEYIITSAIFPKFTEKTLTPPVKISSNPYFGTTIARRQVHADSFRRMSADIEHKPASTEQAIHTHNSVVSVSTDNIGPGPIGIDMGKGNSFSILENQFTKIVNAAPTLCAKLLANASIVEHEHALRPIWSLAR